jgi:hypothetical protein
MKTIKGTLHEDRHTFSIIYRSIFNRVRSVSDIFVEEVKTRFVFCNFLYWKSCLVWDNVEKYGRAGQHTRDISCWIAKATPWLTLRNTQCFSTATTVTRTRLKLRYTYITLPVLLNFTTLCCKIEKFRPFAHCVCMFLVIVTMNSCTLIQNEWRKNLFLLLCVTWNGDCKYVRLEGIFNS